jgi:hypothetical protein
VIDYGENEGYVPEEEPEDEPETPVEPEKTENDGYVQKGEFYEFTIYNDTEKIIEFWKSAIRNKVPVFIINISHMVNQRGAIIGDLNFYNTYINLGSNDIFLK